MYNDERHILPSTLKNIDFKLLDVTETVLIKRFYLEIVILMHTLILRFLNQPLNMTIEYILATKRFDEPLFHSKIHLAFHSFK